LRTALSTAGSLVLLLDVAPARPAFFWWRDAEVRLELQLTGEQVAEIERVYRSSLQERRRLRRAFDRADLELARAFVRGDVTDAEALTLIGRVEELRARRNLARTRMLIRMYQLLTPDERTRLAAIRRRRDDAP
jgi:Spy/CpxP family protein refolding chaperone